MKSGNVNTSATNDRKLGGHAAPRPFIAVDPLGSAGAATAAGRPHNYKDDEEDSREVHRRNLKRKQPESSSSRDGGEEALRGLGGERRNVRRRRRVDSSSWSAPPIAANEMERLGHVLDQEQEVTNRRREEGGDDVPSNECAAHEEGRPPTPLPNAAFGGRTANDVSNNHGTEISPGFPQMKHPYRMPLNGEASRPRQQQHLQQPLPHRLHNRNGASLPIDEGGDRGGHVGSLTNDDDCDDADPNRPCRMIQFVRIANVAETSTTTTMGMMGPRPLPPSRWRENDGFGAGGAGDSRAVVVRSVMRGYQGAEGDKRGASSASYDSTSDGDNDSTSSTTTSTSTDTSTSSSCSRDGEASSVASDLTTDPRLFARPVSKELRVVSSDADVGGFGEEDVDVDDDDDDQDDLVHPPHGGQYRLNLPPELAWKAFVVLSIFILLLDYVWSSVSDVVIRVVNRRPGRRKNNNPTPAPLPPPAA